MLWLELKTENAHTQPRNTSESISEPVLRNKPWKKRHFEIRTFLKTAARALATQLVSMYTSALINHSGGTGNYSVASLCWYRNWPQNSFFPSSSVNTAAILQDINHLSVQTCSKTFMYVCHGGLSVDQNGLLMMRIGYRRININYGAKNQKFPLSSSCWPTRCLRPIFLDF
jgi:hypothetical protein